MSWCHAVMDLGKASGSQVSSWLVRIVSVSVDPPVQVVTPTGIDVELPPEPAHLPT